MPKHRQQHQQNQLNFNFEEATLPESPAKTEHASVENADILPQVFSPNAPLSSSIAKASDEGKHEVPVPTPLQNAITNGAFGVDENDDPVEPSVEEVHEISRQHGERLAELYISLDGVNESLAHKTIIGRDKLIREKERLTCQIQGMLGFYSEDFGEVAARHLESWAKQEAYRQSTIEEHPDPPDSSPAASTTQYDPGHPWHYLRRGNGLPPKPVEEIPIAENDGSFIGKLPKDFRKRRVKLTQVLSEQSHQLEEDKKKYVQLIERGANALSDYDKNIAYGGDTELAVASSLALKFNHISNGLSRVRWLKLQLGLPLDSEPQKESLIHRGEARLDPSSQAKNSAASTQTTDVGGVADKSAAAQSVRPDESVPACEHGPATASPRHAPASSPVPDGPPPAVVPTAPGRSPVVGSPRSGGTKQGGPFMQTDTATQAPTKFERLDRLQENVDEALDRLAESLEAGQSDTLKSWLTTMSRFHNYSLNNQMLIAFQRPDATHVAGFHAWKKFDRLVNKGEKGIMILAPVTRPVGSVEERDEQGNTKEKTLRKLVNTKIVYVFDVSQTHGEPLPELAHVKGDAASHLPALKELIASKGIELYFADHLSGGAQGRSEGKRIGCKNGLPPAEEFRTLSHELAHELLHRGERRQETTRRSRELEAESVAFVVCNAMGLDAQQCSTDYIQLYRGNKQMLLESLQFIREVSKDILAVLMPTQHGTNVATE